MVTVAQALAQAVQQHRAGQLQQAEQLYRAILQVQPQQVDALHLLGVLADQVGQHELASTYIRQAVRLRPDLAEAHYNLGSALKAQGLLAEAQASYEQALRLKPHYPEAYNNLGTALEEQGQQPEALVCYQQAVRLKPDSAKAYYNLGHLLHKQGQLAQAQACYQQALRLQPDYAKAHYNWGNLLQEQGQLAEAQACYQQALRLKPDFAEAHINLGNVLQNQEQLAQAQACYQQAVHFQPAYAEAHYNLGVALKEQGQLAQAQACLREALRLQPAYAEAHHNLGVVLKEQGKVAEALACYQQALHHQPNLAEAHFSRALTWLLAGDFEQGWPEFEWRWQRQGLAPPHFPQPLWDGSPLHGQTILLYTEWGFGDTLHFIRYAPLVQALGGCVLVVCQPELVSLLRSCPGIDQLLPQGSPLSPFDVWAPLLSLPRLLGTSLATVPAQVPYLFADAERIDFWRQELSQRGACKIGIAWDGDPKERRFFLKKCIPLAEFAPLSRLEEVRLFSLQKGPATEQLRHVAELFAVTDLSSRLETFVETAAVIQNLDLVITADVAVAHLAGALGVPVWVALCFVPDWRWQLEREDSPWYPTMRLFRQKERGNWAEVFTRITAALQQRLAQGSGDSYPREGS